MVPTLRRHSSILPARVGLVEVRLRSPASQPAQLCEHVGPSAPLSAAALDGAEQRPQRLLEDRPVGFPPSPLALFDPLARRAMATFAVAAPAGGDLVLDPAGAPFDARDDVLGRRRHQAELQRAPAPDALGPVPLEDASHARSPVQLGLHPFERTVDATSHPDHDGSGPSQVGTLVR